jgi:hypothetical protein
MHVTPSSGVVVSAPDRAALTNETQTICGVILLTCPECYPINVCEGGALPGWFVYGLYVVRVRPTLFKLQVLTALSNMT